MKKINDKIHLTGAKHPTIHTCAQRPTPPLNLLKGTHSFFSLTFFKYWTARRRAIFLMVLAVSLVFYTQQTIHFTHRHIRQRETNSTTYLEMDSQIGASGLTGLGRIPRFLGVSTHDWVCVEQKIKNKRRINMEVCDEYAFGIKPTGDRWQFWTKYDDVSSDGNG